MTKELSTHTEQHNFAFQFLRVFIVLLLLGRSYQAFVFDLPFRTVFWDEYMLKDIIESLTSDTWQAYVTNKSFPTDSFIIAIQWCFGGIWLLTALGIAFGLTKKRIVQGFIWLSSFLLLTLALCYSKERFWQLGQFFEYAAQVSSPVFFLWIVTHSKSITSIHFFIQIAVSITFISHGLYAIGFYPQPDYWLQWCQDVFLFASDRQASVFLIVMGVLDLVAAIGIFIPFLRKWSLLYCVIWGFMTALARIYCNFDVTIPVTSFLHWWHESAYRILHGGLPLYMYLTWYKSSSKG